MGDLQQEKQRNQEIYLQQQDYDYDQDQYEEEESHGYMDAYGDGYATTDPEYIEEGGTAGTTRTVVHDKYESFTMNSLKNQLQVLNTKKGIGSTNPVENAAVNTYRNGKFLLTGVLYNITHIFSWTKRQRRRKKAVAKSMGTALKNFGKNLFKTVGGAVISPFAAVYGAGRFLKNKYIDKDPFYKKTSLIHTISKKAYGYLWGGVVRNTLNTVLMGASFAPWLVTGIVNTIVKACKGEFQGFRPGFDLPTPMMPAEWEHYYEMHSLSGGITKKLEKRDESAWTTFVKRLKSHFKRFKQANWHSFFTGDMRNYHAAYSDTVDYNNMQQI